MKTAPPTPLRAHDASSATTDPDVVAAVLETRAARRAVEAHADIAATVQRLQLALNAQTREVTRLTNELADCRADLASARADVQRLSRALNPPPPETPPAPVPVQCPSCHMVVALRGHGRTDAVPDRCPKCGTDIDGRPPTFAHTIS